MGGPRPGPTGPRPKDGTGDWDFGLEIGDWEDD